MYDNFAGFAGYFKVKKSFIDNTTFQLHYRVREQSVKILLSMYALGDFRLVALGLAVGDHGPILRRAHSMHRFRSAGR